MSTTGLQLQLTGDMVAREVSRAFGKTLAPDFVIDGELFFSVALKDDEANRFIAKVRQNPFEQEEVEWQQQLLDCLEQHPLHYQVPHLIRDLNDRPVSSLTFPGSHALYEAMLLSWVDGELMASIESPSLDLLFDLGRLSASLTERIGALDTEFAHREHHWVLTQSLRSLDASLTEHAIAQRGEEIAALVAFFNRYCGKLGSLPQATVHQDLNPHNITVDLVNPDRVHGVIDFNDAVRTARVADIAIACAYSMFGQSDPVEAFATTVNGYQSVTPLLADEQSVLLPLAMIRLLVNWASWSKLSNGDSESYAASRMRQTFPVIQSVLDFGLEASRVRLLNEIR